MTRISKSKWEPLIAGVSLVAVLFALYEHDARCDESCNMPLAGKSWAYEPTAWQWDGQLVIAVAALVGAAGGVVARRRGATRIATGAFTCSLCAVAAYVAIWFT